VRKRERELVDEYRANTESALASFAPDTVAIVTRMAGLPEQACGSEQIVIDNVAGCRRELSGARDQLARTVGPTSATTPTGEYP
jgi:hypothetical protein